MPWKGPGKRYYYQSKRRGHRVMYTYVGAGPVAELVARFDQLDQERRQLEHMDRQQRLAQAAEQAAPPAALLDHRRAVRDLVRAVLEAHGYRQHKRGEWRKQRMNQLTSEKPTRAEFAALFDRAGAEGSTGADRQALRRVVAQYPEYGRAFDLHELALRQMIESTSADPAGVAVATGRMDALRAELSGPSPSAIEQLLVDQVLLDYFYVNTIAYQCAKLMGDSDTSMAVAEYWDGRLTAAQGRYLRAVESLARVRRLLKLPGPQFNINLPGGQQVNVAGEVRT